ncbi:MAG TPA: tripartite tricarboxylate transporter substrate binding protein [Burkholderiales bacterium]|nr:tripartite tricarboxylate transporter substrate binding protein [Burkholderiales bacterium]
MSKTILFALAAACAASGAVHAQQKYPSKPVRVVVGFAPGGGTDIAARAIAQKLGEAMGASFVVDNRPGAAGNIAAEIVARGTADGHTLLMANSTIAIPSLYARLPFDIRKDFIPVSLVALGPSVLSVHPSVAANDVKGLLALAKSQPGKITYGSGGMGNVTHLAMELLESMTGVDMVHVPYKGAAPSLTALVSGEVQALFSSVPAALPQVNNGKIRALGVSISKRSPAMPNVPTIAEAGVPGYYAASWYGLLAPAGTPRPIVDALAKETSKAMRAADIRDKMLAQGFEPVGNTSAEFAKFIAAEIPRWEKVVKNAGIRGE